MANKIKVRFNLGKGKNYMKWKIWSKIGVEYHRPCDVQLVMYGCQLKNNRKLAERIFNGENKDVCAWIVCDSISIKHEDFKQYDGITYHTDIAKLSYNPRKQPSWVMSGNDVDNLKIAEIVSVDYNLFANNVLDYKLLKSSVK